MFTGIIEEVGTVTDITVGDGRARLTLRAPTVVGDATEGDSIAVDGCCLTIAGLRPDGFVADLMAETLRATALGGLGVGDPVNLERAMAADGRFGGHVVQGHVDDVGTVTDRVDEPGTTWLSVLAPATIARHLVPKGSITLAGASLTVVDVVDHDDATATFRVGLIPHTLAHTTLDTLAAGDRCNLEADVVAKYVARLVALDVAPGVSGSISTTPPERTPRPAPDPTSSDRHHP